MAVTDKINLDFQFISTGDPKQLVILDTSTWSFIEDKPAIIEILVPGSTKPVVYNFVKGRVNIFNSSNLYLSNVGDRNDLPDGIYEITLKGSPDKFCKHRSILKDDKTKLQLFNLYASLGLDSCEDESVLKIIEKNKFLIDAANAAIAVGKTAKAETFFKMAVSNLKDYSNCKSCD